MPSWISFVLGLAPLWAVILIMIIIGTLLFLPGFSKSR